MIVCKKSVVFITKRGYIHTQTWIVVPKRDYTPILSRGWEDHEVSDMSEFYYSSIAAIYEDFATGEICSPNTAVTLVIFNYDYFRLYMEREYSVVESGVEVW